MIVFKGNHKKLNPYTFNIENECFPIGMPIVHSNVGMRSKFIHSV